jgi:hypothetical protein
MHPLSRNDNYLYSIQEDPFYYYTGVTSCGLQVLAVLYYPSIVTVLFDTDGNLLSVSERLLPESTRSTVDQCGFTEAFLSGEDRAIISHLQELGFTRRPIRVKRFFLPQYHIGITDFPEVFRSMLEQPSRFTAEERNTAENELQRWSIEGLFELWLNPDSYRWINRSGHVQSS